MAFKTSPKMPPPEGGVGIIIGVKPKNGAKPADHPEPDADDQSNGAKASTEDAIVLRADQRTCGSCKNWSPSGECSEVDSVFESGDRCLRYYEPAGGEGAEDNDADDAEQPPMGAGSDAESEPQ